jgi:hypothetical protein
MVRTHCSKFLSIRTQKELLEDRNIKKIENEE